ncbi:MAG: peptidylprolyl isomerase [bacterium]|nr:peptidylprolyl isomerase [bacterium]
MNTQQKQNLLFVLISFLGMMTIAMDTATSSEEGVSNAVVNKIVAWVNNEVITLQELNDIIAANPDVDKKEVLQGLIDQKLILQEATKDGFETPDEQIDEIINAMKKQFPTEKAFEDALLKEGVNKEELRERYRENLIKQQWIGMEVRKRIKVSPEKINKIRQDLSCEIRVRHILVKSAEDAVLILARIDRGENFEGLAREYSVCPSGKNGGDLGFFHKYQMIPEFSEKAFNLKVEEVSQIVKTNLGYHIIKMTEKRETPKDTLQILIQEQEEKLKKEAFEQEMEVLLKELKTKAYIVVEDE